MTTIALGAAHPSDPAWTTTAVAWLRQGGVVAYPTETFYGLAVDPCLPAAVEALFDLKGRDARHATPLIACSLEDVVRFCGPLNAASAALAAAFWPGPLSLVLEAPTRLTPAVHAGRGTVAIRVPAHIVARALAAAWGGPLTATSANRSGAPPARTIGDMGRLTGDERVLSIDGGETPGGAPSTIVDARVEPPVLVRDGAIAWNRVLESLYA
jgi:L-threonylcarbamoyladenylate synthase